MSKEFIDAISDDLLEDATYASYQYQILKEEIKEFESTLDENHEVILLLSSFGQSVAMLVEEIR